MRGWKKSILLILLVGFLAPWAVKGRVFRALGVRAGQLNTAGLPWELAYRTTMDVDGRRNEVQVYSARFNEPVVEQLRSQFERQGFKVSFQETADGALGVAKGDGREARILVLSPDSQPNQMVFLFYPEVGNSGKTRFPIPGYPGTKMGNIVFNKETNTICATLETMDSAGQVHVFYAGVLAANGWSPTLPLAGGMAVFRKRNQVCCILAKGRPGEPNRVTLLVKGGGL